MGAGTAERLRSERARAEREMEGRPRDREDPAEWRAEQGSSGADGCHTGDSRPNPASQPAEASLPRGPRGIPAGLGTSSLSTGEGW